MSEDLPTDEIQLNERLKSETLAQQPILPAYAHLHPSAAQMLSSFQRALMQQIMKDPERAGGSIALDDGGL